MILAIRGYLVAFKSFGISFSVDPFMMAQNTGDNFFHLVDSRQISSPDRGCDWMMAYSSSVSCRFFEDRFADPDLADIMQQAGQINMMDLFFGQAANPARCSAIQREINATRSE